MATLFAYHKTHRQGPFLKTYYFTERKHPSIGDNIYVISGDSPRRPRYFLEGLFLVCGIGRRDGSRRELLLNVLITPETPPCINDQAWFGRDKKEFRNIFVSGLNLNPVPVKYELRFKRMLAENPTADELYPIDAINDIGSDHPERIPTTGSRYLRDPRVRTQVLRRAKGRCEYCDEPGFICRDGSIYLESHHIIALADDGADRMSNVIALCPQDHRRAHFGKDRDEVESGMVKRLTGLNQVS